jgi:hypothetical protein
MKIPIFNLETFISILPLALFFIGFWVRTLFDNRDLKRKILEGPMEKFENCITEIASFYRMRVREITDENKTYTPELENYQKEKRRELLQLRNNLIWAARRFQEKKLDSLSKDLEKNVGNALNN